MKNQAELLFDCNRTSAAFDWNRRNPELQAENANKVVRGIVFDAVTDDISEPRYKIVLNGETRIAFDPRTHRVEVDIDGLVIIKPKE